MIFKDKFKTYKDVFDLFTENTLFKLISKGYFEGLESPISIGKESNIFSGKRKDGSRIIIKIYRLSTCDFKKMYTYMASDPRFPFLKKNRRNVIFAWAQREYRNLLIAREGNIRVPQPIAVMNNVLVMEFIGESDPAPKLKDQQPKTLKSFFDETINQMKKLYKSKLIHSDLSAHNILNCNEKPVLIDLSHSTVPENPRADELLDRDINIVCDYFEKKGLKIDREKIKKQITN